MARYKQNVRVAYYINLAVDRLLRKMARQTGRSLSDLVSEAVTALAEKHGIK